MMESSIQAEGSTMTVTPIESKRLTKSQEADLTAIRESLAILEQDAPDKDA
jgi:hypothetical protein